MILKNLAKVALAALTLVTTGCLQSDQSTVVNPDGSGKFTFNIAMDMAGMMEGLQGLGGGGGKNMADPMETMLTEILSKSKGVDVWKEAKIEKSPDGKSKVVLAGYFKDISQLKLGGDTDTGLGSVVSSKDKDGNWVLDMSGVKPAAEGAEAKPGKAKKTLTDDEVKEKANEAKAQMGMMKGMMEQMMGSAKMDISLTVGGTVLDYGVFEKVDGTTGKISMKPAKMFGAIEKMMEDPVKARAIVESGDDPMAMLKDGGAEKFAADLIPALVGREGAPRMIIKAGEPVFDYAKESEAAKAGQSQELKDRLAGKKPAKEDGAGDGEAEKKGKVKLPKAA